METLLETEGTTQDYTVQPGIEPLTMVLLAPCSNQLSYTGYKIQHFKQSFHSCLPANLLLLTLPFYTCRNDREDNKGVTYKPAADNEDDDPSKV